MADDNRGLQERVAKLEAQVAALNATVADLRDRLSSAAPPRVTDKIKLPHRPQTDTSEEILSLVDKSYILSRTASTSFILAIALALRTAADSGTFDLQIGSFIAMLYAFGLIVYGWFAYQRKSIHAPVFTLWGTIVMCSVVVESHRVFATVPTELAYVAMVITGLVATVISRTNGVALPVFAGTIGMSFGSFAIDYPSPVFPYLVIVMALANIFATYATRLLRASWLRWLLFVLTLFMIQIWSMRLSYMLGKGSDEIEFAVQGLLPAIGVFGILYLVIALLGVRGKLQQRISKFDIAMPVLNVCWVVLSARYALGLGLAAVQPTALVGVAIGVLHLAIAWWLAHRTTGGAIGTTSFALAGGLLIAFCAPAALANGVLAMTLVAILSGAVMWLSVRRDNLGLRLSSYLLQLYACGGLVVQLRAIEGGRPSLVGALASGLLATIAFAHYYWARRHPAAAAEGFFARLNRNDRGAALLLVAALFSIFFTLRVGLFQALELLQAASVATYSGAQSVLINGMAAALLLLSLLRKNRELRNVALVVTVIGAVKVFLVDMTGLKGLPLMISVLTFGLVAALASFVLSRRAKDPAAN